MKKVLFVVMVILFSLSVHADVKDPMGLSEYVILEPGHYDPHAGSYSGNTTIRQDANGQYWHERRLTNHEVEIFEKTGFINSDGSIDTSKTDQLFLKPIQPVTQQAIKPTDNKQMKSHNQASQKQAVKQTPVKHSAHSRISKKPLPTSHQIASKTKTKHASHPKSKGTVHVRPTNMPKNPSRDDIVRMQQHIQHIERQVAKALDLSLSAYAVAELPQATEGRSSVSFGAAAADGESAVAAGYSSNFGAKHEYTVKISLSHAGHEEAVGAGIGYQW